MDMAGEVVLDRTSFKALASETRIGLLKRLDKGRRTASQLAGEFSLSVQAVSEHLKRLEEAGLVERKDDGRKWVYFELTRKGGQVLGREKSNVLFLLSVSFLMLATGVGMVAFSSLGISLTGAQNVFDASALAAGQAGGVPPLTSVGDAVAVGGASQKSAGLPQGAASERVIASARSEETVVTAVEARAAEIGWLETLLIVCGTFILALGAKKMLAGRA